jgi:tetratricopeptide (TPR) repeat protein
MAGSYRNLLIRIGPWDQDRRSYPTEAELDDGSIFQSELRLDVSALRAAALDAKAYGLALFNALFVGRIRTAYDRTIAPAEDQADSRLRIRLWIDDAAVELHALVWERMYQEYGGQVLPIATSAVTPFSRYTGLELPEPAPVNERPLRLLVVTTNPLGLESFGLAPIDVEREVEGLRQALGELGRKKLVQVTLLPGRTGLSPELRAQLLRADYHIQDGSASFEQILRLLPTHHILHFIGHSRFARHRQAGDADTTALFLERENGSIHIVEDEEIVSRLVQVRPLPSLVFLAACSTAQRRPDAAHPFVGLAPRLVKIGVPAVVAMQDVVPVAMAQQLASDFYRSLLKHGEVDCALNQARQLLFQSAEIDWAIPVLFMRLEHGQILDLRPAARTAALVPLTRKTWRQWLQTRARPAYLIGLLIGLLSLIATVLALYRDPTINRLVFGPGRMTGDLKIAVARFRGLDAQGRIVQLDASDELAASMYMFLDEELQSLNRDHFDIEIWPPDRTGWIDGATPEARAKSARELADHDHIRADIIIYGTLEARPDEIRLAPEFYIAEAKLPGAEELVGTYQFGSIIRSPGTTENPASKRELRDQLLTRTGALAQFIIGLGYYATDGFEKADRYFQAAESTKGWDDRDGKEVLYLFLGTTANKREDLQAAQMYYARASGLNPEYARARLGLGEVQYHTSRGSGLCEPGTIDADGLRKAIAMYQSALDGPSPLQANIPAKTAFFVGRAYLCLSRAHVSDYREDAAREFKKVIDEYRGNQRIQNLAADAHANLGIVYSTVLPGDNPEEVKAGYRAAAQEYSEAIKVSRQPEWQAYYYLSLTFVNLGLEECDAAATAWINAGKQHESATRPNPGYEDWHAYIEKAWAISKCQKPITTP